MIWLRALAAATCVGMSVGEAFAERALPLANHRAVYDLSLLKTSGAKAPAQARGRIAFDFAGSACEGYVQNFRQITELQPSEGTAKLSDMRSATFEGGDGADFRFKVETRINNSRAEEVDGKAKKKSGDAQLSIDLSKPKRARLELPGPMLFPTEHLRKIVEKAVAGEQLLEARVFDGTGDGEKAFDTLTVIGKPTKEAPQEKAARATELKNMRRWPVAISYFDLGKKDSPPIYVLSFDLYENGVSRALKLDYGDFVLRGEMTDLVLQPTPACNK
ncbi:MAG: cell envelope integrity EipB family protein [Methylocystis sp.]|uniref:cell envelope integrity EipB family protein n=1 Tax=Methylocystis sp. TaxID=1911079 RepID=UPI003D124E53